MWTIPPGQVLAYDTVNKRPLFGRQGEMTMPRRSLLCVLAALCTASAGNAGDDARCDYADFLREVRDLDRLPYLEDGTVSRQFSSYHRTSRYDRTTKQCVGMDQNGDSGHKLTAHFGPEAASEFGSFSIPTDTPRFPFGDLEWVLDPVERTHVFFFPRKGATESKTSPPENIVATIPGPGCIYRIWSANPMGEINFYFDGSTKPMTFDFKSLFLKGVTDPDEETLAHRAEWPFIRPMVFRREGEQDHRASDCYLPIPFAKSCVITLTQPAFYIIGYKMFPPKTQVETFSLPLSKKALGEFDATCRAFLNRGTNPRADLANRKTISKTVQLPPGKNVSLADLAGPGVVEAFHAKLESNERYAHSKVLLTADFDGEQCIWTPLVNFFGTGFGPNDYKSYPLGYIDGEGYCYFPMPFRKSGRFVITNGGKAPATLCYRIVYKPVDKLLPNTMHFKCKYRREQVCQTFDYPLLECEGRGRFVGTALCIDDAWRSWWGEGDEKIWVDDDVFPSHFGTGSEDFFGDAWGIRTLQETFFACSFIDHQSEWARTCCYRWMVPDDVPFRKRFRITIENYPEDIWGTKAVKWDEDYTSVAYWYQMPGGTDFFKPVPVEQRRPWGKVPAPPVIEAEVALAAELQRGAKLFDDEALEYELSRGKAIDLGFKNVGDRVTLLGPEVLAEGPYTIFMHIPRDVKKPAAFRLTSGGQELGETMPDYGTKQVAKVGIGVFAAGRPSLALEFTSDGNAVFDCVQFAPARQLRNVTEAESMPQAPHTGPETATDIDVMWSGGKQLRFPAARAGDTLELNVTVPSGNWSLCVGQTVGPRYGNYDVFVNDKPAAKLRGFDDKHRVKDWVKLTSLKGSNGPTKIRFECTGKDERSSGFELGLDYLGWQRLVVEDAIEGENADLVDVKDGRITDQKLGDRFSGGNHLWFHPTKIGASFTWPIDVPKDGRYELSVYFTHSWDYAIVKLSLDGKELGQFDTCAPTVVWAGKTSLGVHELKQGKANLKFEVVGKSDKSKGILVGVDCVTLTPTR